MNDFNSLAKAAHFYVRSDKIFEDQFNLYRKFKEDNSFTTQEYFDAIEKIDKEQRDGSKEVGWEDFKADTYKHEMEHYKIYKNYGIETKTFRNKDKIPFIMDMNFREVALKNEYDKEKVIKILSEVFIAPHLAKCELEGCCLDLLFYETLTGNLETLNLEELQSKLKQYDNKV